jgi:hypothetical protein
MSHLSLQAYCAVSTDNITTFVAHSLLSQPYIRADPEFCTTCKQPWLFYRSPVRRGAMRATSVRCHDCRFKVSMPCLSRSHSFRSSGVGSGVLRVSVKRQCCSASETEGWMRGDAIHIPSVWLEYVPEVWSLRNAMVMGLFWSA